MATCIIGTSSIRTNAEICDYLSRRIDAGNMVHVVNPHLDGGDTDSEDIRGGEDVLNVVVSRLGDLVDAKTHQRTRGNDTVNDVPQCADEHDVDEIVVGTRKRNPVSKIALGGTTQDVLLHSGIPVAIVPLETV